MLLDKTPPVYGVLDIQTGAVTELHEENSTAITYTGTWVDIDDPGVSGGSVVAAREAGATATVRFRGTGIQWIGYRCSCAAGWARVTLDGFVQPSPLLDDPGRQAQSIVFHKSGLADGEHELKIEVTGRRWL